MSTQQPSREHEPWNLNSVNRPVWAFPACPAGHGRMFVGADTNPHRDAGYVCHAPWCDVDAFNAPANWHENLDT